MKLSPAQQRELMALAAMAPRRWLPFTAVWHGMTRRALWRRALVSYRATPAGRLLIGLTKAGRQEAEKQAARLSRSVVSPVASALSHPAAGDGG